MQTRLAILMLSCFARASGLTEPEAALRGPTLIPEKECIGRGKDKKVNCCTEKQPCSFRSQESKVQYDCIGTESCRSTRFGDKTSARCLVKNACQDAIFRKGSIGNCETPYACLGATFLRKGKLVRCHVERGCQSVYINEGREALCKVKNACVYFSIGRGSKATCTRPGACQSLFIVGKGAMVDCQGQACDATKFLTDEGPEIKCSGDGSCKELIVFCGGTKNQNCTAVKSITHCSGADSCHGAMFRSKHVTAHCWSGNCQGAKFTGGACCYGSGCPKDAPLCTGRACPANSGPECA